MSKKTLNDAWQHYATAKDQSHGTTHIESVLRHAKEIAKSYPQVNARDVEYAAVLHDIGHQAQTRTLAHGGHGVSTYHPIIGVGMAKQYVGDLPIESQTAILDAVQHHHGETLPAYDVGRIVRDADRIAYSADPELIAYRSYKYRLDKGMTPDEAAKNAYHYLRHHKLTRLDSRAESAFLTEQGKDIFKNNIQRFKDITSSYENYAKLVNARGGNVNTNYRDKTAGILDYIATVQKDADKTSLKFRHDNNMIQDAYQAFKGRNVDDEYHKERMKILAGTAAAALGAGLLLYNRGKAGEIISRANENPVRTPLMNKVVRRVGPALAAGGLYGAYAHKDDEDKTARNTALGIAGLGLLGMGSIGAKSVESVITPAEKASILKRTPAILGGGALVGGGLVHSTNAAQKMDDESKVKELLHSKEPEGTVAHKVNNIREKHNIASRYPLTRIFNTVPILENAPQYNIGTPSDKLSPADKALYIKYQKEN